jgi:hypothetical protein
MKTVRVFANLVIVLVAGYLLLQVVPTLISEANTEKMLVGAAIGLGFIAFAYTVVVDLVVKLKKKVSNENG